MLRIVDDDAFRRGRRRSALGLRSGCGAKRESAEREGAGEILQ